MIVQSTSALHDKPRRIISLVPSQTELLAYLGLEEQVIGITKFCIHPKEWKANKAIIGGTKNINLDKIRKLQPDLIIANKEENVQEQVEALAAEYNVWVTDVSDLKTSLQMMTDIGELTGTLPAAEELMTKIATSFTKMIRAVNPLKTAYIIWRNPYMAAGGDTFIHDMLAKCGLENVFAASKRYPETTIENLKMANCRLIILSSEPYPFKQQHIKEIQEQLQGVKIILADGEMFSWYGSRLLYAPAYFEKFLQHVNNA